MSESSGDTPEWLKQHTETPNKIFIASSSDDEDDLPLIRRTATGIAPGAATGDAAAGHGPSQPQAETQDSKPTAKPPPRQQQQQHHAAHDATPEPALEGPGAGSDTRKGGGAREVAPPPLDLSQQQQQLVRSPANAKPGQRRLAAPQSGGGPSIAVQLGVAEAGRLPIMMPEKLNRNKVLLELPPTSGSGEGQHHHGAADLSGDSGAVGRLVVVGAGTAAKGAAAAAAAGGSDGGDLQLQVDLKGVMYNAWVLPLAATALVLNIGPTEAKIESIFNDFVRLREAVDPYGTDADGGDGAGLAYLLDGDDENYQMDDAHDAAAQPAKGAKAAKAVAKPRKKAAADKAAGGSDKKTKPGKAATALKKADGKAAASKKAIDAGAAAKKAATAGPGAAKRKPAEGAKGEAKKNAGATKATAKDGDDKRGGEKAEKKKTAASQGLGVKAGGVVKPRGAGAGAAAAKKQTTLTALAAKGVAAKGGK